MLAQFGAWQSTGRWRHQLGVLLLGLLLLIWVLALVTHHPGDPAFSTSGDGLGVRNRAGLLGAWLSDLSLVLLGHSAWWLVLFVLRLWLFQMAWLVRASTGEETSSHASHKSGWNPGAALIGLAVLVLASAGLEWSRFYDTQAELTGMPAGGAVGATIGLWGMVWLGFAGSGIFWIVLAGAGMAFAFGFSWLVIAEEIGAGLDSLRHRQIQRREQAEDTRIGAKLARDRERELEVGQSNRKEPVIEPPETPEARSFHNTEPGFALPEELSSFPQKKGGRSEPVLGSELASDSDLGDEPPVLTGVLSGVTPPPMPSPLPPLRPLGAGPVVLPKLSLLDPPSAKVESVLPESLEMTSRLIEKKLSDFGVEVKVLAAQPGPVITRYEIEPAVGVKGAQVMNLAKDLARSLSLTSIRVVETIPGKACMALELPNLRRQGIRLSEIIGSEVYAHSPSPLTLSLGKDIVGQAVVADLARMPHLLVAGTTGSGKSVGINAMILSLLYKAEPADVRIILIDPKMLEMSVYEGIPHLLAPVVTDMKQAANALTWCVAEMERRYRLMSRLGVRNLAGYNKKIADAQAREELIPNPFSLTPEQPEPLTRLPHVVVVIDELADLMMVVGKKIEELIARLAQKARAAGIHLILATQRPSVDVITGLIKANIPTRIAFQVSSKIDSRTILDQMGAEALLGQGDMLYLAPGTGLPVRVHGAFVSDEEVHRVVQALRATGAPDYIEGILEGGSIEGEGSTGADGAGAEGEADPMYDQAVAVVMQHRRASISLVQRHLRIGYNRAARLLEQMEKSGLVSSMATNGNRDLLVPTRSEESV